jgi:AcrR family transcriptional regulator
MSTGVDVAQGTARKARSSSAETRARVLHAARMAFSRTGFDHVGVRDIAMAAQTDAAIVIRLFGSKEALFAEVADHAFSLEPFFAGPLETLGKRVARYLLQPRPISAQSDDFDAFQFLLRSAISPVASPIVSASLEKSFVKPLAALIGGREAKGRASLITGYILGITTLRFALISRPLEEGSRHGLTDLLGNSIQACLTGFPRKPGSDVV